MRTRPFLIGLALPIVAELVSSAHAHTGTGVSIVGPDIYQSQPALASAIPISEAIFSLALLLLGIHFVFSLRKRQFQFRSHLLGASLVGILALGVLAGAMPSYEVSITPPVSFRFYFGGDTGYYSGVLKYSNMSNRLIQSDFFLDLGDISYNGTTRTYTDGTPANFPPTGNEVDWCNFVKTNVQNRLGIPSLPYIFITGNHEDGNPNPGNLDRDGYIDAFIGNNCMPLSAFNSTSTAGDRYINFVGSGLCTESYTCYGKEGYFDYPAANPIARIITLTVADSVGNSTNNLVHFNYCPLSMCDNPTMNAHWDWLTAVISAAKDAGRWIIVAFHKPCISPDFTTGCEGDGNNVNNNGHNPNYQLEKYLLSHGVDVLLNAHSHIYARSKQLTCLGPTEPESDSTDGITYDPTCVANDGSSGVYTRGAGTVEVIQGVFSQRSGLLNFSRADINYFAKAMSAQGTNPVDCCWTNGSPIDMASGNGVGMMTVSSTQISFAWVPSISSHNPTSPTKFTDSFVIRAPINPPNSSTPNELLPLIIESSIAAVVGVVATDAALIFRRRRRNRNSRVPASSAQPAADRDGHYSVSGRAR